ncbi:MAG: hypothetical protein IT450_09590 [Phycisphaerales bacterium]|nr:hypothetical protein [Phycisphaerales bacterium]
MDARWMIGCVIGLIGAVAAVAQTPLGTGWTYQGKLDDAGNPASGPYDMHFRLYDAAVGGTQLGPVICYDNASVTDGLFTVTLDFGDQFAGQERFLEIAIRADAGQNCANTSGFTTLAPRHKLTAAPNALNADKLDGLDSTAFLQSIPVPLMLSGSSAAHIIRGENASTGSTSVGVHGRSTAVSGETYGVSGRSNSTSGIGVYGEAPAATGFTYGGRFRVLSTSGCGVFGEATALSGTSFGGLFQNASSDGVAVRGWATASGGAADGGRFETNSTGGRGVFGYASAPTGATYGGYFRCDSPGGHGVYGYASAATGITSGGSFRSDSTTARAVLGYATASSGNTHGGYFQSDSTTGIGVLGVAGAFSSGNTYGGNFQSYSPGGTGVYGLGWAASGTTYGGSFQSNSTSGLGVFGLATAANGSTYGVYGQSDSTSGRGLYGYASATSGTIYGVRGFASTAAGGYAVYAAGDMGASGVKPFRIDHPQDPQNKYLLHYAAESPEVINFYSGNVTLDARGEARVELPAYFASVNKDPRYALTAVGAPMPNLHVAEEISEAALAAGAQAEPGDAPPICTFRIAGGVPGAKVSWEVKAVRNDLRMRLHGAPVEPEKADPERGKYQHPEYYGQPPEMGVDYDAERGAQSRERLSSPRLDGTQN